MVATSHFMVSPVHKMTDPHSQDASASRQGRADETHVYTGAQLIPWVQRVLNMHESCLVFLCGAPSSGKSQWAVQAAHYLGPAARLVSDHPAQAGHESLTQALQTISSSNPTAIICDEANTDFSHFASKVILGLGAGIAVRNVAWFVFDHGLPLADEARVLSQGSQHQEASEAFVRQLRATFFKDGGLVQWSDEFISSKMLQCCWKEVLMWDAIKPETEPPPIDCAADMDWRQAKDQKDSPGRSNSVTVQLLAGSVGAADPSIPYYVDDSPTHVRCWDGPAFPSTEGSWHSSKSSVRDCALRYQSCTSAVLSHSESCLASLRTASPLWQPSATNSAARPSASPVKGKRAGPHASGRRRSVQKDTAASHMNMVPSLTLGSVLNDYMKESKTCESPFDPSTWQH